MNLSPEEQREFYGWLELEGKCYKHKWIDSEEVCDEFYEEGALIQIHYKICERCKDKVRPQYATPLLDPVNLQNPNAETFLWMMERAGELFEHTLEGITEIVLRKSLNGDWICTLQNYLVGDILKSEPLLKTPIGADTPPKALLNALITYWKESK